MKITVIIPVYNGAQWMAQCLENVLCQNYEELEVIVIDDGSTDGTADIAANYPAVHVVRQENQGVSVARNVGLGLATGEYIHFMDIDDWLSTDFYNRMAEAVMRTGADMAVCSMINEVRPHWTRIYSQSFMATTPEDKFELTNVYEWGYVWRYLIRRAFIEEHELTFNGRHMGDMAFSMKAVYEAAKVVTAPEAVYCYKRRKGSLINSKDKAVVKRRKEHWKAAKAWRDEFMREHGLKREQRVVERSGYMILGMPLLEKHVSNNYRTHWYLLGIPVVRKKIRK